MILCLSVTYTSPVSADKSFLILVPPPPPPQHSRETNLLASLTDTSSSFYNLSKARLVLFSYKTFYFVRNLFFKWTDFRLIAHPTLFLRVL